MTAVWGAGAFSSGSTPPFGMRLQQYALPSGDPCGRTVAFPSHAAEVRALLQQ